MIHSDTVGMLRVSRSISYSELHDLEQILRENFCTFSSAWISLMCESQTGQAYSMCGLINDLYSFTMSQSELRVSRDQPQ